MRDPNLRTTTVRDRSGSNWGWIAGAIVVLLILGALVLNWNRGPESTASNTGNAGSTAPNTNATAPATTTGSGAGSAGSTNSSAGQSNPPPANTPAR
jgi:hypothetical protein